MQTKRVTAPRIPELVAAILFGVAGGGGGVVIIGGKLVRIPPRSPILEALNALAASQAAEDLPPDRQREIRLIALRAARKAIDKEIGELSGKRA